jgi:arsenate reductase (glutaredoxin)
MSEVTIYHNPRCSKSRNTLAILEEQGVNANVVLYLETSPDEAQVRELLGKLGMSASQLVRKGEDEFKSSGLSADSSEDELIRAMAEHPRLIERPIVVKGDRAVLGRPPENVLDLVG